MVLLESIRYKYQDGKIKILAGSFGKERLVVSGEFNNLKVAIKLINSTDKVSIENLEEKYLLENMHHKHIIRYIGHSTNVIFDGKTYHRLIFEQGISNLDEHIKSKKEIPKHFYIDLSKAVKYLHEDQVVPIVHLDINPENIIIVKHNTENILKLAGFGKAKEIEGTCLKLKDFIGTLGFEA
jgi:serine/threonine protein kinase